MDAIAGWAAACGRRWCVYIVAAAIGVLAGPVLADPPVELERLKAQFH